MNNAGRSEVSRKWLPFHQSSERASNTKWKWLELQQQGELGLPLGPQVEGVETGSSAGQNRQIARGRTSILRHSICRR